MHRHAPRRSPNRSDPPRHRGTEYSGNGGNTRTTPGTVKTRLHRARQRFARFWSRISLEVGPEDEFRISDPDEGQRLGALAVFGSVVSDDRSASSSVVPYLQIRSVVVRPSERGPPQSGEPKSRGSFCSQLRRRTQFIQGTFNQRSIGKTLRKRIIGFDGFPELGLCKSDRVAIRYRTKLGCIAAYGHHERKRGLESRQRRDRLRAFPARELGRNP